MLKGARMWGHYGYSGTVPRSWMLQCMVPRGYFMDRHIQLFLFLEINT